VPAPMANEAPGMSIMDATDFDLSDEIKSEDKRELMIAAIIVPAKPSVPALRRIPRRNN